MILMTLVPVALVLVLGLAAVPVAQRRRAEAAQHSEEQRQAALEAATAEEERRERVAAVAAAADRRRFDRDPVGYLAPTALQVAQATLPYWEAQQAARRARAQAEVVVSRRRDEVAAAEASLPARWSTPASRQVLLVAPAGLLVAALIETYVNHEIFKPLSGPVVAAVLAPLAVLVLGVVSYMATAALRAARDERAETGQLSYGAAVVALAWSVGAVGALMGLLYLAPARSAAPHEAAITAAQAQLAQLQARADDGEDVTRSLAAAERELGGQQEARRAAATSDRVVVVGAAMLEIALVELVLLGAPLRALGAARRRLDDAEADRLLAVEREAVGKVAYQQALNPPVGEMVDHVVNRGVPIARAREIVEQAFVQTQVVDVTKEVLRQTHASLGDVLDPAPGDVVAGEVVASEPAAAVDDDADDRTAALAEALAATPVAERAVEPEPRPDPVPTLPEPLPVPLDGPLAGPVDDPVDDQVVLMPDAPHEQPLTSLDDLDEAGA